MPLPDSTFLVRVKSNVVFFFLIFNNMTHFIWLKDGTEIQCFVAKSLDQVVGVALLRREEVSFFFLFFSSVEFYVK